MKDLFTQGCPSMCGNCPSSLLTVPLHVCVSPGLTLTRSPPLKAPLMKSPISRVKDDEHASLGEACSGCGVPSPVPLLFGDSRAIFACPKSSSSSCMLFGQSRTLLWLVVCLEWGWAAATECCRYLGCEGAPAPE